MLWVLLCALSNPILFNNVVLYTHKLEWIPLSFLTTPDGVHTFKRTRTCLFLFFFFKLCVLLSTSMFLSAKKCRGCSNAEILVKTGFMRSFSKPNWNMRITSVYLPLPTYKDRHRLKDKKKVQKQNSTWAEVYTLTPLVDCGTHRYPVRRYQWSSMSRVGNSKQISIFLKTLKLQQSGLPLAMINISLAFWT